MESQPLTDTFHTADDLFARSGCTHTVTMNNPSQNIHLERTPTGFKLTFGSSGEEHASYDYASLEEMYQEIAERFARVPHPLDLRAAIWQDISNYPAFPYSTRFHPLEGPIELHIPPTSEQVTAHGPHVAYGPADITSSTPNTYRVTPTADWLVMEYPPFTYTGRFGQVVLRPTRNILDRWRLHRENARLRRERPMRTVVRPDSTVVYGHPPADWRANPRSISGGPFLVACPFPCRRTIRPEPLQEV